MKTCSKCGESKPHSEFHKRSRAKDGLAVWCKPCTSAYSAQHYQANREKVLARSAARFEADRDAWNARSRAWFAANRERALANGAAWREDHRSYFTERAAIRRAILNGADVSDADLDALWTGLCGICGEQIDRELAYPDHMSKSLDHIVPLSKGGAHAQENLQWAHLICNIRKGARAA